MDIYIASCDKNGGIFKYEMTDKGTLKFKTKTEADCPMYLASENNKMYVLLRSPFENGESGLVSYDITDDDLINPSEVISTKGVVACHLAVENSEVYCVNYLSGNVVKIPDKIVCHSGKGVHPTRQTEPHTHFVGITHDGYVLATDLGIDKIFTYTKDMEYVCDASVPEGHGARHLIFSEDNQYLYCVNELKSTVSVFKYHDGHLTLLDTYNALPENFNGENTAAAIRVTGNKLYVSNRGHDSIAVFDIYGDKLCLNRFINCGGKEPRDFNIFGSFLISTNQASDNVTVIDLTTDEIIQNINIKAPLCVI